MKVAALQQTGFYIFKDQLTDEHIFFDIVQFCTWFMHCELKAR
jgi:hypothetical protein